MVVPGNRASCRSGTRNRSGGISAALTPWDAMSEHDDPFESIRKIWSAMGVPTPGVAMPTLDPAEIEKRLGELRSVETWLTLNLNMLRMTIQGMELQLSAVKAMHAMPGELGAAAKDSSGAGAPGADNATGMMNWPWTAMQQFMTAPSTTGTPPGGGPTDKKDKK